VQSGILERTGIPYHMNERQRWLLANAMAHKKANKRCSIAAINLPQFKQASLKTVALAYLIIELNLGIYGQNH
jgi:hypothetical protein